MKRSCSPCSHCRRRVARSRKSCRQDGPIVYGHHHVAATDIEAQKKFFAGALGGTAMKFGAASDIVKFPGVLVMFRAQKPTGGTKGTTVNHIGFSVPNLRATVDKVNAAGYPIDHAREVASDSKVKDDIAPSAPPALDRVRDGAGRREGGAGADARRRRSRSRCTTSTSSASRTPRCARGT